MADAVGNELLELNQRLLDCIAAGDWQVYRELCDESLTAFEPEARGSLVEGLSFHEFYFKLGGLGGLGGVPGQHHTTMCSPHVRVLGDVAILAYVRLNQRLDAAGQPVTHAVQETRVWHRQDGRWRHVHFHRSPIA